MSATIIKSIAFGLLSFMTFLSADYSVKRWVLSHDHWFNYSKVEFLQPVIAGEPVYMLSFNTFKRGAPMVWNDTLFCYLEATNFMATNMFTVTTASGFYFPKGVEPRPWKFLDKAPDAGVTCYSKHVITINVGYGLEKMQIIQSDPIQIKERKIALNKRATR